MSAQPADKHFPILKLIYNYFTCLALISITISPLYAIANSEASEDGRRNSYKTIDNDGKLATVIVMIQMEKTTYT